MIGLRNVETDLRNVRKHTFRSFIPCFAGSAERAEHAERFSIANACIEHPTPKSVSICVVVAMVQRSARTTRSAESLSMCVSARRSTRRELVTLLAQYEEAIRD